MANLFKMLLLCHSWRQKRWRARLSRLRSFQSQTSMKLVGFHRLRHVTKELHETVLLLDVYFFVHLYPQ